MSIPNNLAEELNVILENIDQRLTVDGFPDTLAVLIEEKIIEAPPAEGDVIHIPVVFEVIDWATQTPEQVAASQPNHKTREIHISLPVLVTVDGAEVFHPEQVKETITLFFNQTPEGEVVIPPFAPGE